MGSADRFLRGSAHAQSPTGAALSRVIGHRGARNRAPENTIAALRAAKELGCAWVEMDVMLTKDKIPVLHHDNDLARCTDGKGSLWDFTIDEIELLDAGASFSAATAGERIPRLAEALRCCRDLLVGLNLEVKHVTEGSSDVPTDAEREVEEELAHIVCDTVESCAVSPTELVFSSYSRPAIAVLRRRLPHFACAYLVEDLPQDWQRFMLDHQCESLIFQWDLVPKERIAESVQKVPCFAYTVNDGAVAHELLSLGVCGVISDCPDIVAAELCKLEDEALATDDSP
jgi:glycerophosphoryl diester phosphodiesterase